ACLEHYLFFAFIKIICTALLMQIYSAAPSGFYLMYYLFVLVGANLLSKFLLISKTRGQFFIFLTLMLLKFLLIYLIFIVKGEEIVFWSYLSIIWKGALMTLLLFIPVFKFHSVIDSYFQYLPAFDKK
ncbi:MAG: hypothetical protein K2X39_02520, partial [Silvanigrellaceae bacterium]|nr:hypothetical protein [Silvanigrellaceae bacterium]